jgi:hypothetical protein
LRDGNWKANEAARRSEGRIQRRSKSVESLCLTARQIHYRDVGLKSTIRVIPKMIFIILVAVTVSGRSITGSVTYTTLALSTAP